MTVFEPSREQVLEYCARDPIERVFLEDVARRGLGRFSAVADPAGSLTCLCHAGANVVPSGPGSAAFAPVAAEAHARMIIGELGAVSELWREARELLPTAREDRPHQPVYAINEPPPAGKQYAMVRVTLTYGEGGTDDKANPLVIIRAVGPSNTAVNWTDSFVVAPDALVTTDAVLRGQSITGNIVFAVTSADAARLVVYASAGFGSDDVFFATAPR